jgi:Rps23 Pro-64 3,4-dihydroxylase Tpa1-like proline 4-hydroxylase
MREVAPFAFDRARLDEAGRRYRAAFSTGDPFPHVVIDGLLPDAVLDQVLTEFPAPEQGPWQEFDGPAEIKLALADTASMGPATRNLLAEFNGQVFIEFLESLTGIEGLISDPHYVGGGLHQIRTGGFLKVHADFNRHTRLQLDRRLNVLLYLNRDWEESWGGHLELWDQTMTRPGPRILPVFNRMVVFATTDAALHGHPDPLACPPHRARRSMALYYYSNGRPPEEVADGHTTIFRARPGEGFRRGGWKATARRWIPPALVDLAKSPSRR